MCVGRQKESVPRHVVQRVTLLLKCRVCVCVCVCMCPQSDMCVLVRYVEGGIQGGKCHNRLWTPDAEAIHDTICRVTCVYVCVTCAWGEGRGRNRHNRL